MIPALGNGKGGAMPALPAQGRAVDNALVRSYFEEVPADAVALDFSPDPDFFSPEPDFSLELDFSLEPDFSLELDFSLEPEPESLDDPLLELVDVLADSRLSVR
jgi:hypothetical protein